MRFWYVLDRDAQYVGCDIWHISRQWCDDRWASSSCHYHAPLDATRAAPVEDVFSNFHLVVGSNGVEFDKCGTTGGWTNHGFLLHSWRHWKTGNSWLNPPWTTFRWCGKRRWFSKRRTYPAKRKLVAFPLMGRLFVEYFRWKKLRTQIKWFMFLSWHTSTIRRWIAQDDEQIGPLRY